MFAVFERKQYLQELPSQWQQYEQYYYSWAEDATA
jgi:hypothetical protein